MPDPAVMLKMHSLALLPAGSPVDAERCHAVLVAGGAALLEHVIGQGLGALWHYRLQTDGCLDTLPAQAQAALRQERLAAATHYMGQRYALEEFDRSFAAAGIPYVVIKGAHVRELVYPDPALRPAGDIDILIAPEHRRRAAQVLLDAGYRVNAPPENISHEATFTHGRVGIDLHWHILRPGRTRIDMTAALIQRRRRIEPAWVLSDHDAVFLMLTHPAFAKYVCSPNMGLIRAADFLLWIQQRDTDWPAVLELLERAGLKTAAWAQLSWFRMLITADPPRVIDEWLDTLHPGRLRAAYLRQWLLRDLPSRWLHRPMLIQAGLTLPLHDRPSDALHALTGWYRSRRARPEDQRLLLG